MMRKVTKLEKAEVTQNAVMDFLEKNGVHTTFQDDYYDISLDEHNVKLEVKSASIMIAQNKKANDYRIGKFRFRVNKEEYVANDCWIAFCFTWLDEVMILGFARAKDLPMEYGKMSIKHIMPHIVEKEEFLSILNQLRRDG